MLLSLLRILKKFRYRFGEKRMKKKILKIAIKIICLCIILFIAFFIGECLYPIFSSSDYEPSLLSYNFYKSETYVNPEPFLLFEKYYYLENPKKKDYKYNNYKMVKNNEKLIRDYINVSLMNLHKLDNSINIEFNYDSITSNDYYLLKTFDNDKTIVLHYYDVDKDILYVTYFPEEYATTVNE